MELRAYLRTLLSKWWIVLLVFAITYGVTLAFTFTQQPVYQSKATYVVKLNSSFGNDRDLASAVDILSRRTEIATTYTMVASSALMRRAAADALRLTPDQRSGITVLSQIVPGTNVLEISVQAPDPQLAHDFASAVGLQMSSYVRNLYETYTLEPLDQANVPDLPIKPNKALNLALGAVMGLLLGASMAFLAAYLQAPVENVTTPSVFDEGVGVYNQRYLMMRLRQELSRAQRNAYPLSLALVNADHAGVLSGASEETRQEVLRRVSLLLTPHLRDEDTLAYFGGSTFAFLLPDLRGEAAKLLIERVQAAIATNPIVAERSHASYDLRCSAGIVTYTEAAGEGDVEAEQLLDQASRMLKESEAATYGKIAWSASDNALLAKTDVPKLIGA